MAFFQRKRFDAAGKKGAIPDGLWMKCAGCKQTVFKNEVEQNMEVCPACGHHYRIGARRRLELTVDPDSFEETHPNITTMDPLHFSVGKETYQERVQRAREQSQLNEALVTGFASIEGTRLALGVMDSSFIMASMGSAIGEKFCRLVRDAVEEQVPLAVFCASGGARMQEGILALMQMAKTADAVRQMNEAGLPYITVLTDPTSGGVFASFASLGDIVLAEPEAYIGFAGARLIEGALKVKIPDGFQRAEYQFENGFIDEIVKRTDMRAYLGKLLRYLAPRHRNAPVEMLTAVDEAEPLLETASTGAGTE
ncbi:MAG: acetyl-CoA carboxylase carboxyltransferase subunit beta [Candidatus Hydrogenedentes bacterium]|nr:acetyl-CoA carboxylase carboxyltransferase subunit beta [Candidatus Hydrogenedentota bacterium]MBI3119959.1 acetyl-CoA carboxylase carboxyltransferase subunit beta [Candidatus Hydrogenedentota bacterium]